MNNKSINIFFLGDISLNDRYNNYFDKGLKPFEKVKDHLTNSDFVIGNLECMSRGEDGENLLKKPRLKTDTQTLEFLKDFNLSIATLAHNHIYDNLESGFTNTIKKLNDLNIQYLGAGYSEDEAQKPLIIERNGIKIAYINYVTSDTNPNIPKDANIYLNDFSIDRIIEDIIELKKIVDYVVCLFHWGGKVENGMYPDFNQPKIAYKIIDSGADLIIGHHSHTLQPYEVYKGKYIFYSLGNFCFSDIYSDDKLHEIDRESGCQSIILNIEFYKKNYKTSIQHIENGNGFILLNNSNKIKKEYNFRNKIFKIIKTKKYLWKIYWIKHKHYNPIKFYFFGNDKNSFTQLKLLSFKKVVNYILKKLKGKI